MIFTPLVGAILTLFIPKDNHKLIRMIATAFAGITLVISFAAWGNYESESTKSVQFVEGTQYVETKEGETPRIDAGYLWFEFGKGEDGKPKSGIYYFVGVDGLSMPLLILTTILSLVAVIISFNIDKRVKEYYFFLLLLEVGMVGVFCALDFFLFYVFWEIMLVPMYFLVGIWGGPKKEFAAIKFFLYTLFGSVFMLIAILAIYFYAAPNTFNLLALKEQAGMGPIVAGFQGVVWFALFLGFAIKVPVFPFHTWLPLAHVEAPTAVSIILAGVLLKMGTYGLLRINYAILPRATRDFAWLLVLLGLINVVYGAFCALAQKDIKKMIAYSSINHMGYCLLGMASLSVWGLNGAIFQQLGHGFVTGALFLLVGVVYDRAHHRDVEGFGGLGVQVPKYAGVMTLACMASLGMPGLIGFVGEFLCFLGGFNPNPKLLQGQETLFRVCTGLSVIGILITAGFFLWMIQRVFLGKLNPKYSDLTEMDNREVWAVVPLCIFTILGGIYPAVFMDMMDPASHGIVAQLLKAAGVQ